MSSVDVIIDRLSSSQGDSDNGANIALAEDIVRARDAHAVRELVEHLHDKNKRLQSDCIKTLYEIGEREPKLIAGYVDEFAVLLLSKNQRLVWGAMCSLDGCASANAKSVYLHLASILKAAEGESVIARDHAVSILSKLCKAGHDTECFPILLDILRDAPVNQVPSYAETAASVVTKENRSKLAEVITLRLKDVAEHKPKVKRLEKVLKQLQK
jgi:hypothetical protein